MAESICLFLTSVFMASTAQVLLKKSASQKHEKLIQEYINGKVLTAYCMMFLCTLMSIFAYRKIALGLGAILETVSYLFVTIFGVTIFGEKISVKKVVALLFIISGIFLYVL